MPRQHTITLYKFEELSEVAKQRALTNYRYTNVGHHDWWDFIYGDARNVHIEIKKFDTNNKIINLHFLEDRDIVAKAIIDQHGDTCESKHAAAMYLLAYRPEEDFVIRSDGSIEYPENGRRFDSAMRSYYLKALNNEYEYLTSDEAVIGTIEVMELEFTENGEVF